MKMKVLFVCTGNACRSQMAEGWARKLYGNAIEVYSAGILPSGVDPKAVKVMTEVGVDISKHVSEHVNDYAERDIDLIVTVSDYARSQCPKFHADSSMIHHRFDDPPMIPVDYKAGADGLHQYRRVRDEIREFVESLTELSSINKLEVSR